MVLLLELDALVEVVSLFLPFVYLEVVAEVDVDLLTVAVELTDSDISADFAVMDVGMDVTYQDCSTDSWAPLTHFHLFVAIAEGLVVRSK